MGNNPDRSSKKHSVKKEDKFAYGEYLKKEGFDKRKEGKNGANTIDFVDDIIEKLIKNKEFLKKCKEKDLEIDRGKDHFENNEKKPCSSNPFEMRIGGSNVVLTELSQKQKTNKEEGDKIALQVFADQTYFGCGILLGWTTQEESTLRDANPEIFAYLKANDYIKEKKLDDSDKRYEYNRANKNPLSTSDGYLIKGEINVKNNKEILNEGIPVYFIFTSMPSLSGKVQNQDVNGVVSWTTKTRNYFNMDVKQEVLYKLVQTLYNRKKEKPLGINGRQVFKRVIMLLMFSGKVNLPKNDSDAEINATIQQLAKLAKDEKKDELPEFKEAKENYDKVVRQSIRAWIVMAREKGVKIFIGGAVGCGVFENEPEDVSKMIAEEFIEYGGDMKYIYPAFRGEDDDTYHTFKNAFETAFNNFNKK